MSVWLTPGAEAVLRRHLLSADVAVGPARASSTFCSEICAGRGARTARRSMQSADSVTEQLRGSVHAHGAGRRVPVGGGAAAGSSRSSAVVRHATRRLRRRAEISAAERAAVPAARARADRRRRRAARWCSRRCGRWRSAACAITSAAASIAIRSTPPGACRTSRRCSTTRRSSCSPISKRRRRPAIRSTSTSPRTRCAT